MTECPSCQTKIDADDLFCPECGTRIEGASDVPAGAATSVKPPAQRPNMLPLFIGVIALVVAIVAYLFVSTDGATPELVVENRDGKKATESTGDAPTQTSLGDVSLRILQAPSNAIICDTQKECRAAERSRVVAIDEFLISDGRADVLFGNPSVISTGAYLAAISVDGHIQRRAVTPSQEGVAAISYRMLKGETIGASQGAETVVEFEFRTCAISEGSYAAGNLESGNYFQVVEGTAFCVGNDGSIESLGQGNNRLEWR